MKSSKNKFFDSHQKQNVSEIQERLNLIKRNTAEIIGEEDLKNLLEENNNKESAAHKSKGRMQRFKEFLGKKSKPVVYWGTATTGRPHVGYFFPMLKIADFLKAGFEVKVLLADLHAALDNVPWHILEKRYKYYAKVIPMMIQSMGINIKDLKIVKGSDFQLKPEYMFDVLRMSSFVSVHDSNKAASEVVKMGDNPKMSGLIYPLMQAIDEQYLGVDIQLGGTDQRKIMVLARENLPKIGYEPRIEILNPLIPGLIGKKMSASDEKSKIDLLDDEKIVLSKITNAECIEGNPDNGIMAFLKYVVMTIKKDKKQRFIVERDKKYGGNLEFSNYEEIEKMFAEKKLHPQDLKNAVAKEINHLLMLFQKNKEELKKLEEEAYSEK